MNVTKIILTRSDARFFHLKFTKFNFGCVSAPDHAWGAHSAPQALYSLIGERDLGKGGEIKEGGEDIEGGKRKEGRELELELVEFNVPRGKRNGEWEGEWEGEGEGGEEGKGVGRMLPGP